MIPEQIRNLALFIHEWFLVNTDYACEQSTSGVSERLRDAITEFLDLDIKVVKIGE